jgi:hypothetical protein
MIRYPMIFILCTSAVLLLCCTHETNSLDDIPAVCFDTDILPVFTASCATTSCHDISAAGGLRLETYSGIMEGIVPGNSAESELYQAVTSSRKENRMPPDHPLSTDTRMLLRIWIDQGAEELYCNSR